MTSPNSDNEPAERIIELRLPSRLGYEKVAMDTASSLARRMGFGGDRVEALRTAIAEAVTNAIEHGNEHDSDMRVLVMLTARPDELVVSVADQGIGIPPEDLARVFERFYRVGGSADAVAGQGLGLSICKEIVTAHGGRIWAESEGQGRGSTFSFTLPLAVGAATT